MFNLNILKIKKKRRNNYESSNNKKTSVFLVAVWSLQTLFGQSTFTLTTDARITGVANPKTVFEVTFSVSRDGIFVNVPLVGPFKIIPHLKVIFQLMV